MKDIEKTVVKPSLNNLNLELLREMVNVSNNSLLTKDVCIMLSSNLSGDQMSELLRWFRHANREISFKLSSGKKF